MVKELDEINIMGVDYDIQYVDVVNKENPEYGEVNFFNSVIKIDNSLSDDMKQVTLIHEIIHCICLGLGLYEISENEIIVQSLSTALYDVWKTNFAGANKL